MNFCENVRFYQIFMKYKGNKKSIVYVITYGLKYTRSPLGSLFKWRVTVSGELMFFESYANCDVTNTVTPFMTSQNILLRFLINTVTLLLLIFRRVSC